MRYLYSWLKEHHPTIPALTAIESMLVQLGHDVDSIEPLTYPGVSVVQINTIEKHPNADSLSVVTINDGTKTHTLVCGAPNIQVGQKAAYAQINSTLPCGLTLSPIKIRGIVSDGMLCAEDELGIGPNHTGLLSVPQDAILGEPLYKYLPPDAVISIEVTPDRGDVLSHFGLARDIKAIQEQALLEPSFNTPAYVDATAHIAQIGSVSPNVAGISFGAVISESPPSTPLFMQSRLFLLGQKSINLATDITNYLLFEYGQPLHAYDLDKLTSPIVLGVQSTEKEVTLRGLNGVTYNLPSDSLVVTNNDTPISLAGIMGGEDTKVTKATKQILFEAAAFSAKTTAKTARSLGIITDSAQRFSRGVDPQLHQKILPHALALWQSYTGFAVYEPLHKDQEQTKKRPAIIPFESIERFFGTKLNPKTVTSYLTSLGCQVENDDIQMSVTPPSWRDDLALPQDYFEELVRSIGVQSIPKKALPPSVPQGKRSRYWRIEQLKDILVSVGGYEIQTYPFMSEKELHLWGITSGTLCLNQPPLEDKQLMRTTLKPSSVATLAANPDIPHTVLFEISKIYLKDSEPLILCIAVSSQTPNEGDNFWRNLFERLKLPVSSWMARVTMIDEPIKQAYKLRKLYTAILEIPVEELLNLKIFESPSVSIPDIDQVTYTPLAKYQASRRDIAFVVDQEHNTEDIAKTIRSVDPQIVAVELFDTYKNDALGKTNYSVAYHIYYQSNEKTLSNEDVQLIHAKVEAHIKEHYHASIR
jgi:phenylalanyl-tRNA synthetase beta chain